MYTNKRPNPVSAAVTVLLVSLLNGCPDKTAPPGPAIIRVNGEPITLEEFEKELEFELTHRMIAEEESEFEPVTQEEIKTEIIHKKLIPLAAVRSRYRDKIPDLLDKAKEIRDMIKEDRSNFAALSERFSTPSVAANRGRLGPIGRGSGLPCPLLRTAFSMGAGDLSEPFLSPVGCHVLWVRNSVKGALPCQDRVDAAHILLAWEDNDRFLQDTLPKLVSEARIEIVDPAFEKLVRGGATK